MLFDGQNLIALNYNNLRLFHFCSKIFITEKVCFNAKQQQQQFDSLIRESDFNMKRFTLGRISFNVSRAKFYNNFTQLLYHGRFVASQVNQTIETTSG